jgi:hypothetical protein
MRAISALRQAFGLHKSEELGKRFTPEQMKRITNAMKDYGASKCKEQRETSQKAFDVAYDNVEDESDSYALYNMRSNKEILSNVDEPEYD